VDPERAEALLVRGQMLVRLADAEAVEQTAQALEALPGHGAAAATLLRAQWQGRHGSAGRADRAAAAATERLPADAPPSLRLRFASVHAKIKEDLGQFGEAVRLSQQGVVLADATGTPWRRAEKRADLAYSLTLARELDAADRWLREAEALALRADDPMALAAVASARGILAGAQGRPAEELRGLSDAITHARRAGAEIDEALGLANLADHFLKRGQPATALALAQTALPLSRHVRDPISESVALTNSGLALIAMGRLDEGLLAVRGSLAIEQRLGSVSAMEMIQDELAHALEHAGHLRLAWEAYAEHRRLADRLQQQQHQQAVIEQQEAFEHEARQREMALLDAERQLRQAELRGRTLQQRLLALAALGVLLLGVALTLLMRRLRRSNRELQHTNQRLQLASECDALTGLANRRRFQRLMAESAAGTPGGGLRGALLIVDIDHFKHINDRHGHAAGDAVLVELAARLRAALRDEDLVVRWGGEEFLVAALTLRAPELPALAERLLQAVGGQPVRHGDGGIPVTASIGYAAFPLPPHGEPLAWERAVDLVDTAMYLAKAHGRNRAYGLRALPGALPAAAGRHAADTLEADWRAGRAQLTPHAGPAQPAAGVVESAS
jgi:diguanylate cyclase (GGDEF)-like protein